MNKWKSIAKTTLFWTAASLLPGGWLFLAYKAVKDPKFKESLDKAVKRLRSFRWFR